MEQNKTYNEHNLLLNDFYNQVYDKTKGFDKINQELIADRATEIIKRHLKDLSKIYMIDIQYTFHMNSQRPALSFTVKCVDSGKDENIDFNIILTSYFFK